MRNLLKDTLIYGLSAVLSRGLALVVLPIYTRMLSPHDYGALDMLTTAGTLASLVVALEITQAVARLYGEADGPEGRRTMASTAVWFATGAYLVALGAALLAARPLSALLLGEGMEAAFRIGAAFIAVVGIFYVVQNQLRIELRSKDYAIVSLVYAIMTILLGVGLGYLLGLGLTGVLLAQLFAAALALLLGAWMLRGSLRRRFDVALLKEMLLFSMPLVPSGLATFLTLYANRILLNAMVSLSAVGLFGVGARIAGISALLTVGLQSALTPLIFAHYKEPATPPRLAHIFEVFLGIALLACLILGQFAGELLHLVAEPRYAPAAAFVMALAPATLLGQMYIFFPGIAIERRMHLQLVIFTVTGGTSLAANWGLIAAFGLPGAVVATFLSSLLFLVLWVRVSQRLYPLPVRWAPVVATSLAFLAIALASFAVNAAEFSPWASITLRLLLVLLFAAAAVGSGLIAQADIKSFARRIGRLLPAWRALG